MDQDTCIKIIRDRLNACKEPRKVYDALRSLAKVRVQNADHMQDQGDVLLCKLSAIGQQPKLGK